MGRWTAILSALASHKCRHEFTVWEPTTEKRWRRICVKCRIWETRLSETEPPPSRYLADEEQKIMYRALKRSVKFVK